LQYIERAAPIVKHHLAQAGVSVLDIHARAKRMWSLYRKLKRYDMDPDKVMDLVALRIIVPDVRSCYETLGAIHAKYKPVPGRVKDFIALPKPNGYRSLHTTVFCEKGRIAEIQIRTPEMHDHAENGVAAHWAYSEQGKRKNTVAKTAELAWVNQLKATLKDIKSAAGMADVKLDFFKDRIFVLTPKGDVKDLPEGATPVDLAYAVHSEIGHRTNGALVNGRLVPLAHKLASGDVVEIAVAKAAKPSKDWLRFVKTTQAAKHIRSWFRREEQAEEGGTSEGAKGKSKGQQRSAQLTPLPSTPAASLLIAGQPGLAYKLGKCCEPTSGMAVIGYLTRSRGVTVHAQTCVNLKAADTRRLMEVRWN
jgi:GTP pyrophosphokinase